VQAISDVIVNRQRVEERAFLKHHPDLLANAHHLFFSVVRDVFAVDEDLARIRFQQSEHELDDGRLAAARAAKNDLGLALHDFEAEIIEDYAVVKREHDVAKLDRRNCPIAIVNFVKRRFHCVVADSG